MKAAASKDIKNQFHVFLEITTSHSSWDFLTMLQTWILGEKSVDHNMNKFDFDAIWEDYSSWQRQIQGIAFQSLPLLLQTMENFKNPRPQLACPGGSHQ